MKRFFTGVLLLSLLSQAAPVRAQKAAGIFAQAQHESDPHKAIDLYSWALLLDPQNARAYEKRALVKEQLGQTLQATADLDTLIGLEPALPTGYYLRARCLMALDRPEQALADYAQAIERDDYVIYPDAHLIRARTYLRLDQPDKALPDLNWYSIRYPNHSETHYLRGLVYTQKGHYTTAIRDFSRVIRLGTDRVSDAYGQRASLYYTLGNTGNAGQDAEQSLLLDPRNELATRVKQQLAQAPAGNKAGTKRGQ